MGIPLALVLAVAAVGALALVRPAGASGSAEQELAQRYAPVIAVQRHDTPCGAGEPYAPVAVDAVLGRPGVTLRAGDGSVIADAPTAADLFDAPPDAHLDLPGNALAPGCDYERWFASTGAAAQPTVYARVATDPEAPGRLVVQYWLFWVYNDWNDRHEGDWEMLQVAFTADSATAALQTQPVEVAVAQHEGSERRPWDRVQQAEGHPVVFPGTGSHATYYTADRWFGKSAASGFGCDDTRGPSTRIEPAVVMLPAQVTGADDPFAWLDWAGHWGEDQPSFNNGPTGPITKDQWAHPIVWMEQEGRTSSVSLPTAGSKVTDFFCTASEKGSLLFIKFLDRPWLVALALLVVVGVIVVGVRRTLWSPDLPVPLVQERRNGQILRGAARLLVDHRRRFLPISLLVLVGGLGAALVQRLVLMIPAFHTLSDTVDEGSGPSVVIALIAGALVSVPVAIYAAASATRLAGDIDRSAPSEGGVLRGTWRSRALPAMVPLALAVVFGGLLLPLAVVLLVWWVAAPRAAEAEGLGVKAALARSRALGRGSRWRIAALVVVTFTVAALTGPFVGTLVLLASSASFVVVNIVSALFGAVMIPWAANVLVLLHGDLTAEVVQSP